MDEVPTLVIYPKGRIAQSFEITPSDVVEQIKGSDELLWRAKNGPVAEIIRLALTSSEGFNARITNKDNLPDFAHQTRKLLREEGIA